MKISVYGFSKDGSLKEDLRFIFDGHAGYSKKGTDIVCAGISAIVQGSFKSIVELTGVEVRVKKTGDKIEYKVVHQDKGSVANLTIIIKTMLISLGEILKAYPEYIEINYY